VATFFTPEDEMDVPAIHRLKRRAFEVTKINHENQEELQMQRYKEPRDANGQLDFYVPHYDSQPEHDRKRVCTLIVYLEAPAEGGETIFPMVHVNTTIRKKHLLSHTATQEMAMNMWRDGICDKAARGESDVLAVKPKKGAAILFYTLQPDGNLDRHSVHGSCPVLKGQKTVTQQWISDSWMAPHWAPEIEGMWRNPQLVKGGCEDSSRKGRALTTDLPASLRDHLEAMRIRRREKTGGDAMCSTQRADDGGVLAKMGEARSFTFSSLVFLETCSEHIDILLSARLLGSTERVSWDISISNCRITLWGPSHVGAGVGDASFVGGSGEDFRDKKSLPPMATGEAPRGVWFHVAVVTEDLNFNETRPDLAEPWSFKTFLIVSGQGGAKSVEGKLSTAAIDWEDSSLCFKHDGLAKFSQTYLFSRQLSQWEVGRVRVMSQGDRSNNRVPP